MSKWVDYTKKYGLCYLLADNTTGVYFNDKTIMLDIAEKTELTYIYR